MVPEPLSLDTLQRRSRLTVMDLVVSLGGAIALVGGMLLVISWLVGRG